MKRIKRGKCMWNFFVSNNNSICVCDIKKFGFFPGWSSINPNQFLYILINLIDQTYLGMSSSDLTSEPKSSVLVHTQVSIAVMMDCVTNSVHGFAANQRQLPKVSLWSNLVVEYRRHRFSLLCQRKKRALGNTNNYSLNWCQNAAGQKGGDSSWVEEGRLGEVWFSLGEGRSPGWFLREGICLVDLGGGKARS